MQKILSNVTVTQSGMLRVMAFLVQNPDLVEKTNDLVFAVEQIAKNTENISKQLEKIAKEVPKTSERA